MTSSSSTSMRDSSDVIIQPTPPGPYMQHHRLLYRGSLSLPDSDLLLEGLTFTAHIPASPPTALLGSHVALSLESMRGRPSLRFVSCVKLVDVPHECTGLINMYIHPRSILARQFFEHALCADRIGPSGVTTTAIRIGLGDGYGPEETDLLIFGSLLPARAVLRMAVARVVPRPASCTQPRPDDPNPRLPQYLNTTRLIASKKRRHPDDYGNERQAKRGKMDKVDLKMLTAKDIMFRLPGPSATAKSKRKANADRSNAPGSFESEDGLGTATSAKDNVPNKLEVSNKTVIKKLSVKALTTRGIPKEHPEFRDLFGWITRGVGYALRNKLKAVALSKEEVQRLVDAHVLMYFDGYG